MTASLREAQVEFIVVGAHALAAHGIARATGDIDILVRPSVENAQRVLAALAVTPDLVPGSTNRPRCVGGEAGLAKGRQKP